MNQIKDLNGKSYFVIDETDLNRNYDEICRSDVFEDDDAGDISLTYSDLYNLPDAYKGLFITIIGKIVQIKDVIDDSGQKYNIIINQGKQRWIIETSDINISSELKKNNIIEVYGQLNVDNKTFDDTTNRLVCIPKIIAHFIEKQEVNNKKKDSKLTKNINWGL